jgi:hypothetical protein
VLAKLGAVCEVNWTHTICSDVTFFGVKVISEYGGSDWPIQGEGFESEQPT